jgi:glycogen debranching enzyme
LLLQAPELFDAVHAKEALDIVEYTLLGPLGMKTLDSRSDLFGQLFDWESFLCK